MVNKDHVLQELLNSFKFTGSLPEIDDAGQVSVDGSITLVKNMTQLSVMFSEVTGHFDCSRRGLITLKGSPHTVGLTFSCKVNRLTTLLHGPNSVESYDATSNPLINLDGLATKILGYVQFDYHENLPILRTLVASNIWPNPDQVKLEDILHKYRGQGKKAALACAAELIKAGYKDNARW